MVIAIIAILAGIPFPVSTRGWSAAELAENTQSASKEGKLNMPQNHAPLIATATPPTFEATAGDTRFSLGGVVGHWLQTVVDNWLLVFPRANPAIIQMFRDRDCQPPRKLVEFSGEFAGKYLVGALQIWQQTREERLWVLIDEMVHDIIDTQAPDGYLAACRRTG